jgi:glycine/D-amino acid oxidase-like deaminating enzyme
MPAPPLPRRAEVVICGAGIVGIAAAYHLAARRGVRDVLLVDERAPLTLTSDKSMECYRNWHAGPDGALVALMNRSIDLLEEHAAESGNVFRMNRRGYGYVSADPARVRELEAEARLAEAQGAGPLRIHAGAASDYRPPPPEGWEGQPSGADLITDPALLRRHFPCLGERTLAVLHTRRCGAFSAQQLGMYLLERAREAGVRFASARVEGIDLAGGRVAGVRLRAADGAPAAVGTDALVLAPGPYLGALGRMAGLALPVYAEPHPKVAFTDARGALPREVPLLICADAQRIDWSATERAGLARDPALRPLLEELPRGAHLRPEGSAGSRTVLMLWTYHAEREEPHWPLPVPKNYAEVVLRGVSTMVPALGAYLQRLPRPFIDGGFLCKTEDNRPLIGPTPVAGLHLLGAFGGYGLMAAPAAGELLAASLIGGALPDYAPALALARFAETGHAAPTAGSGREGPP